MNSYQKVFAKIWTRESSTWHWENGLKGLVTTSTLRFRWYRRENEEEEWGTILSICSLEVILDLVLGPSARPRWDRASTSRDSRWDKIISHLRQPRFHSRSWVEIESVHNYSRTYVYVHRCLYVFIVCNKSKREWATLECSLPTMLKNVASGTFNRSAAILVWMRALISRPTRFRTLLENFILTFILC
jgi:hypothetical protein